MAPTGAVTCAPWRTQTDGARRQLGQRQVEAAGAPAARPPPADPGSARPRGLPRRRRRRGRTARSRRDAGRRGGPRRRVSAQVVRQRSHVEPGRDAQPEPRREGLDADQLRFVHLHLDRRRHDGVSRRASRWAPRRRSSWPSRPAASGAGVRAGAPPPPRAPRAAGASPVSACGLPGGVVGVGLPAEDDRRLVDLLATGHELRQPGGTPEHQRQHAAGQRVERAGVADPRTERCAGPPGRRRARWARRACRRPARRAPRSVTPRPRRRGDRRAERVEELAAHVVDRAPRTAAGGVAVPAAAAGLGDGADVDRALRAQAHPPVARRGVSLRNATA